MQLHNLGKFQSKVGLKEQFNSKKIEIENNDKLSKEEKLLQIKNIELELNEKIKKVNGLCFNFQTHF